MFHIEIEGKCGWIIGEGGGRVEGMLPPLLNYCPPPSSYAYNIRTKLSGCHFEGYGNLEYGYLRELSDTVILFFYLILVLVFSSLNNSYSFSVLSYLKYSNINIHYTVYTACTCT